VATQWSLQYTEFVTKQQQTENNRVQAKQRISGAHSKLSTASASKSRLKMTAPNINFKRPGALIHGTARLINVSRETSEEQSAQAGQAPAFFVWRTIEIAK
jgi:hypothetical protein